jgi:hypothetical protein
MKIIFYCSTEGKKWQEKKEFESFPAGMIEMNVKFIR